jgi:hypothetical protein
MVENEKESFGFEETNRSQNQKAKGNPSDTFPDDMAESQVPELRELKAVILSLDWEISDETMSGLFDQLELLKKKHTEDNLNLGFFKLMQAVGKYIHQSKANSHPNAIKLLNSSFNSLEKVLEDQSMPELRRKKLLAIEVNRFKDLKEQIARRRALGEDSTQKITPEKPQTHTQTVADARTEPERQTVVSHQDLSFFLKEIKILIREEFKALREEIENRLA